MQVATAVPGEVEAERVVTVRRRHRLLAVPSGAILFLCLFLPVVESCGEPVYPYEAPVVCAPYLAGLIAALLAVRARPVRLAGLAAARAWATLEFVWWMVVAAWFAMWTASGDGLIGAALSVWASVWLAVAAWVRRRDLVAAGEGPLPRAQLGAVRIRQPASTAALAMIMLTTFAVAAALLPAQAAPRAEAATGGSGAVGFRFCHD